MISSSDRDQDGEDEEDDDVPLLSGLGHSPRMRMREPSALSFVGSIGDLLTQNASQLN